MSERFEHGGAQKNFFSPIELKTCFLTHSGPLITIMQRKFENNIGGDRNIDPIAADIADFQRLVKTKNPLADVCYTLTHLFLCYVHDFSTPGKKVMPKLKVRNLVFQVIRCLNDLAQTRFWAQSIRLNVPHNIVVGQENRWGGWTRSQDKFIKIF